MLERRGAEVDTVIDGREAREAMTRQRYDLVFLDVNMPAGGAYDLLGDVRQRQPPPRIVIMSGYSESFTAKPLTCTMVRPHARPTFHPGAPKKPYVGALPFLQLAKPIRREMCKIELAIAKHLEELKESDDVTLEKSEPKLEKAAKPHPVQVESEPTGYAASKANPPKHLPALTAARVATVQSPLDADAHPVTPFQKPIHQRREIPTIAPPPRKKDKYAGVNR